MNHDEQLFGDARLSQTLLGKHEMPLGELQSEILTSVRAFTCGANQNDDITVLLVRYRPESVPSKLS